MKNVLKSLLAVGVLFFAQVVSAQDVKKDAESVKTKMEAFSSKTGSIVKFIDTKLPILKTSYGGVETRIRKISNGPTSAYFYQISKEGKYSTTTASIEYDDLKEILKALSPLKAEYSADLLTKPDYMENRFTTVDGFQVGYYIDGSKGNWYIKLEKYGSDNAIFFSDSSTIEASFTEALAKIEELKK